MANIIKQTFKYQEQRRTLFLNLANKDNYGRHRGQVLYGMRLVPDATAVIIRPGAIHTAYGTKFYFDVTNPSQPINRVDVALLQVAGNGVFDASNDIRRPMTVAIVAEVNPETAAVTPEVEDEVDLTANSIRFRARIVAHSRVDSHPTLNLLPHDPVGMDSAQDGAPSSYDPVQTYSQYGGAPVVTVTSNPENESLGIHDVILGYIIIGNTPGGGTPAQLETGSGEWAPGVRYVPCANAWESLTDFLGFDPLLGRVSGENVTIPAGTALSQTASAFTNGAGNQTTTYLSPKFGTPRPTGGPATPWNVPWNEYRRPSFLKDGEQLIWQLRRLDYILRLWMDRTGDQTLVSLIQDGSPGGLPYQAALDQILNAFDGSDSTVTNANVITWSDNAAGSGDNPDNQVTKSGVIAHTQQSSLGTAYGDTHKAAIDALNIAVRNVLRNILGLGSGGRSGVPRATLRDDATWAPGTVSGMSYNADSPESLVAQRPTIVLGASSGYLASDPLYVAIEKVAQRGNQQAVNLLLNPGFLAGTGGTAGWSTTSTGALSTTTLLSGALAAGTVTLNSGGSLWQEVAATDLDSVLDAGQLLSVSVTVRVDSGSVRLALRGWNATSGGTLVLEALGQTISTTSGYVTKGFQVAVTSSAIKRLRISVEQVSGSPPIRVAGAWLGAGPTPANPALDFAKARFLDRFGGANQPMKGPLYMGAQPVEDLGAAGSTGSRAVRSDEVMRRDGQFAATGPQNFDGQVLNNLGAAGTTGSRAVRSDEVMRRDGQFAATAAQDFGGQVLNNLGAAGTTGSRAVRNDEVMRRDGQFAATGDIDFGNNNGVNVAPGTQAGHAVEYGQFSDAVDALTTRLYLGKPLLFDNPSYLGEGIMEIAGPARTIVSNPSNATGLYYGSKTTIYFNVPLYGPTTIMTLDSLNEPFRDIVVFSNAKVVLTGATFKARSLIIFAKSVVANVTNMAIGDVLAVDAEEFQLSATTLTAQGIHLKATSPSAAATVSGTTWTVRAKPFIGPGAASPWGLRYIVNTVAYGCGGVSNAGNRSGSGHFENGFTLHTTPSGYIGGGSFPTDNSVIFLPPACGGISSLTTGQNLDWQQPGGVAQFLSGGSLEFNVSAMNVSGKNARAGGDYSAGGLERAGNGGGFVRIVAQTLTGGGDISVRGGAGGNSSTYNENNPNNGRGGGAGAFGGRGGVAENGIGKYADTPGGGGGVIVVARVGGTSATSWTTNVAAGVGTHGEEAPAWSGFYYNLNYPSTDGILLDSLNLRYGWSMRAFLEHAFTLKMPERL
jgi:hypothetical protein